jgi:hypothetical protein
MFSPPTKENGKTLLGQTSMEKISAWKIALAVLCWVSVIIPLVVGVYTLATNGQNPKAWLFLTLRQSCKETRPEIQKPVAQKGVHEPEPIPDPDLKPRPEPTLETESESESGPISEPEVDPGPPPAEDFDAELQKAIAGKSNEEKVDFFLGHSEWFTDSARQDSLFRFLNTKYGRQNIFFDLVNWYSEVSTEKAKMFFNSVGSYFDADKLFAILTMPVQWYGYSYEMPVCISMMISNPSTADPNRYRDMIIGICGFMEVIKNATSEKFKDLLKLNILTNAIACIRSGDMHTNIKYLVESLSKLDLHFGDVIAEIRRAKSAYAEMQGDPKRNLEAAECKRYREDLIFRLPCLAKFTENPNAAIQEIEKIEKTFNEEEKNLLAVHKIGSKLRELVCGPVEFDYDGVKLKN